MKGRGLTRAKGPPGALVGPLAAMKLSNREARLRRLQRYARIMAPRRQAQYYDMLRSIVRREGWGA